MYGIPNSPRLTCFHISQHWHNDTDVGWIRVIISRFQIFLLRYQETRRTCRTPGGTRFSIEIAMPLSAINHKDVTGAATAQDTLRHKLPSPVCL